MMTKRHRRAMAESQWTPEQALEWAISFYQERRYWPKRRWRIETSFAGNSKLMDHARASRHNCTIGGRVVELIPSRAAYLETLGIKRWSKNRDLALGMPPCPSCTALESEPCVTPGGTLREPHATRVKLVDLTELSAGYETCPTCSALPDLPCTNKKGGHRMPHAKREKRPLKGADLSVVEAQHG